MVEIANVNVFLKSDYAKFGPNRISNCDEAYKFICDQIGKGTVERFILICMDYDYLPINYSITGIGNSEKIIVDLGEIFKTALLTNAKHIIVAHNHLGSSLEPTESDINTTKQIGYAGKILNIPLIDSLVVNSNDEYLSIRQFIINEEKKHEME